MQNSVWWREIPETAPTLPSFVSPTRATGAGSGGEAKAFLR
jgi:hypothetical protein